MAKPIPRKIYSIYSFSVILIIMLSIFSAGMELVDYPTPTPHPLTDISFFTGEPCSPPCWYGLELGKSNLEEVITTLESLPFVNVESIEYTEESDLFVGSNSGVQFTCVYSKERVCGILGFESEINKLHSVTLPLIHWVSFEEVLAIIGEPDDVAFGRYDNDGCHIRLRWKNKNVIAHHVSPSSAKPCNSLWLDKLMAASLLVTVIEYTSHANTLDYNAISWPGFEQ